MTSARTVPPRKLFAPIALALIIGAAAALAVVFLSQGQRLAPQPAVRVAAVKDITVVPTAVTVTMQDGLDRVQQRIAHGPPCSAAVGPVLGCPDSTPLRAVTVFLVLDDQDAMHAFIGKDPRNSCALIWRADITPPKFYDPCHGSFYDRWGKVVGGPSPWNLNEVSAEVREGDIYLDPNRFVLGACPGCR